MHFIGCSCTFACVLHDCACAIVLYACLVDVGFSSNFFLLLIVLKLPNQSVFIFGIVVFWHFQSVFICVHTNACVVCIVGLPAFWHKACVFLPPLLFAVALLIVSLFFLAKFVMFVNF